MRVGPWQHPNHRPAAELPGALRRAPVTEPVRQWIGRRAGSLGTSVMGGRLGYPLPDDHEVERGLHGR